MSKLKSERSIDLKILDAICFLITTNFTEAENSKSFCKKYFEIQQMCKHTQGRMLTRIGKDLFPTPGGKWPLPHEVKVPSFFDIVLGGN